MTIAENFSRIQDRIAEALHRSGRKDSVQLVGVTKYVDVAAAQQLFEAGCTTLGESRPQQLWQRADELSELPICWHMIGHLQRNKIKRTLPLVELIHSVDSRRLAAAINEQAAAIDRTVDVCLEVNVSGDEAKHGFAAEELPEVLGEMQTLEHLRVVGLMGMASFDRRGSESRQDFQRLRTLFDELSDEHSLTQLSMGMSGDFEVAIEEGSTIVRVGSALFEGVPRM